MGSENRPRWSGPGLNAFRFSNLQAIGIAYERKRPIVATDVIAENAVSLPKDGRPRIDATNTDNHTALIGVYFFEDVSC